MAAHASLLTYPMPAGSWVRSDLDLADMQVAIMQFTTTRITAPWLTTTTAERIAGMLNYFLEHLTGVLAWLLPAAPTA